MVAGLRAREWRRDRLGEMPCAAVGEIIAIDRGDDHMAASRAWPPNRRYGDGSSAHRAPLGMPGACTLQKAQARVQVSPMIMKVACFFSQHSPILGQPASSQTVTRLMFPDDGLRVAA